MALFYLFKNVLILKKAEMFFKIARFFTTSLMNFFTWVKCSPPLPVLIKPKLNEVCYFSLLWIVSLSLGKKKWIFILHRLECQKEDRSHNLYSGSHMLIRIPCQSQFCENSSRLYIINSHNILWLLFHVNFNLLLKNYFKRVRQGGGGQGMDFYN